MTVELTPFGVACNLGCTYCYEDPMRAAGNIVNGRYDMEKMKAGLEREGARFSLFGGEPLLMPLPDLEELFRWGRERFEKLTKPHQSVTHVQTNGTLITEAHVALFKQYRVSVGISMDGPGELNDARWAGSLSETREMTARSELAIRSLLAGGIVPSLIVTLHTLNATPERLPRLAAWFRELDGLGIVESRLHPLEVDSPVVRQRLLLDQETEIAAFLSLAALEAELAHLRFDVFYDIRMTLLGRDEEVSCTFNPCDPLTTRAVDGVDGQGERENCGRTNKDGINWRKADHAGFERQLALYRTPQADGGCAGCRFFFACKGQCPGTGLDGDWRSRSAGCALYMALFEEQEARLVAAGKVPLSRSPDLHILEERLLAAWAGGQQSSIHAAADGGAHQDTHGDTAHGDAPHGDSDSGQWGSREHPIGVAPVVGPGVRKVDP